jgi:hypothetical protein
MMVKYIALGVAFVVIVFMAYKGLQVDQTKTEVPGSHIDKVEASAPINERPAEPAPVVKMQEKKIAEPIKKAPALQTEVKEHTLSREVNDLNEKTLEEEHNAPTVKRSQLIGGADVEWIEPKPREDGDVFGKPPGW